MKTRLNTIFFLLIMANLAYSCRCITLTEFGQTIDDSDQIFIGKVINKESITDQDQVRFNFELIKQWKGNLEVQTSIATSTGDCAVDFIVGETYLVYAKKYFTNICRRSSLLEKTFDERLLDHYFKGTPIHKKMDSFDKSVIANRLNLDKNDPQLDMDFVVVFDYRVLSTKEIYSLHPKYFSPRRATVFTLNKADEKLVGSCIGKVITTGIYYPKNGWKKEKIFKMVKRKKICS